MRLSGTTLMLLASISFSLMAALVKWLSDSLPVAEIIFVRCLLPLPLLVWMVRRKGQPLVARNRRLMLLRSGFGCTAMVLYFFVLGRAPLADVALLSKLQPVFVAVLAPVLIAERPGSTVLSCLVVSVVGAVLVLQPSLGVGDGMGLVIVAAAAFSAAAHVTLRRQSAWDEPEVVVLDFTALVAILSAIAMVPVFVMPSGLACIGLAAMAACATLGQLFQTHAYARDEAPGVAAVKYSTVALGVVWGWVFWDEVPAAVAWMGGAVILAAGAVLLWSRRAVPAHRYVEAVD